MVVFEDGLARKGEYRRFIVRGAATGGEDGTPPVVDDTAAMHEVLTRRFRATSTSARRRPTSRSTTTTRPTPTARGPTPGRGGRRSAAERSHRREHRPPAQVRLPAATSSSSTAVCRRSTPRSGRWPTSGSTTSRWSVWPSGSRRSGCRARTSRSSCRARSEGLYLLQRVRDEAHRFAITFHRQRRSKAMTASALDGIPGLGETRRKALLKHFGSVKRAARRDARGGPGGPGHRARPRGHRSSSVARRRGHPRARRQPHDRRGARLTTARPRPIGSTRT